MVTPAGIGDSLTWTTNGITFKGICSADFDRHALIGTFDRITLGDAVGYVSTDNLWAQCTLGDQKWTFTGTGKGDTARAQWLTMLHSITLRTKARA